MRASQADALARFQIYTLLEREEFPEAQIRARADELPQPRVHAPARFSRGLSSLMHGLADRFKHQHHGAEVRPSLTFCRARALFGGL